jgi:RNA polymerase sigma-70 factor, ECF subfamily
MVDKPSELFILSLTEAQPTIYACIYSLLPDRGVAHDLLQETNLTLLRKVDDFEPGTNFNAWATRIARYHVLNHRRKMNRDRLIFDESLIEELGARQVERNDELCRYAEAMRCCLQKLPTAQRQLLEKRYSPGGSVAELAKAQGKSVGAISQLLYRLRQSLMDCVYQRLQEGAS